MHLDERLIVEYKGSYSQYKAARAKDEERLARIAERQTQEIKRLTTLADSMRHQTQRRARTAKMLDTRVARMRSEQIDAPKGGRSLSVRFPEPPRSGKLMLEVTDLAKGYGGPPVFEKVTFDVARGERMFIMGLNGAGKTSLLRILAGRSEADRGDIRLGVNVSIGYYAQEHEGITPGHDPLWHMRSASAPATGARTVVSDQQLRSLMGMFGLRGDIAFQDAGTLSGGEKTKLALAQLVAGKHNLLLLDEPTNNLD
ncbi:MAG: ATP-binding cassette domain-containing protein, partial [Actinomycetota bacterium]